MNISAAQVLLRWSIQNNVAIIPKAAKKEHIRNNKELFSFSINNVNQEKLNRLHSNLRVTWDPTNIH